MVGENLEQVIELPRSKLTGYQNTAMKIYPKGVTPEFLIGVQFRSRLDSR